jgi:hypothetical protein
MKNINRPFSKNEIDQTLNAGFSCIFVNGVSFSEKEEIYFRILKETYEYKPELYEDAFRFFGSLNKKHFP